MSETEPPKRRNRRGLIVGIAAVVLVLGGGTLIAVAATAQKTPPRPPSSQAAAPSTHVSHSAAPPASKGVPTSGAAPTSKAVPPTLAPATRGPVLAASVPVSFDVPAIGAHSSLLRLGLQKDGTIAVPPVDEKDSHAGWYDKSPTPGQLGPAIILGHIDSAKYGPGIFFKLGALRPGDPIDVTRADGTVAVFTVDKVEEYSKNNFPTLDVYGNIDHAGLRLITCGGKFNPSIHSYDDNIVAYASLVSSRKA